MEPVLDHYICLMNSRPSTTDATNCLSISGDDVRSQFCFFGIHLKQILLGAAALEWPLLEGNHYQAKETVCQQESSNPRLALFQGLSLWAAKFGEEDEEGVVCSCQGGQNNRFLEFRI